MFPHFNLVERAWLELKEEGKIARRTEERQVEDDKGLITRRAAYYVHEVDPNFGILEKTQGNNSRGFSVDIIIHRDGRFWDVATDRDGEAVTINPGEKFDTDLLPRWRKPTRELADLPPLEQPGETQPKPEPSPVIDDEFKAALAAGIQQIVNVLGSISGRLDAIEAVQRSQGTVLGNTAANVAEALAIARELDKDVVKEATGNLGGVKETVQSIGGTIGTIAADLAPLIRLVKALRGDGNSR